MLDDHTILPFSYLRLSFLIGAVFTKSTNDPHPRMQKILNFWDPNRFDTKPGFAGRYFIVERRDYVRLTEPPPLKVPMVINRTRVPSHGGGNKVLFFFLNQPVYGEIVSFFVFVQ